MNQLTVWLNILHRRTVVLLLFLGPLLTYSQALSLDSAISLSRENYPQVKQKELIRQAAGLNIENIRKGLLPQLSFSGQASYQSEVTAINVAIPGFTIPSPDKDQYRMTADITQLLYDGGITRQQQKIQQLGAAVEDQQIEVELHQLKDKVVQLFLGILFIDEQMKQALLVKNDILTGLSRLEAQVQNGVALRSARTTVLAESIKADQRLIELKAARKGFLDMLGLFVARTFDENAILIKPSDPVNHTSGNLTDVQNNNQHPIERPELTLFQRQSVLLDQQYKVIRARNLPKTSLFVQTGYGRPGLNLLKNEFDFFYIGGLRLNWALGGLYTNKNDRQLVQISEQKVDLQKQTFLLTISGQLKQQQAEIDKLQQLAESDSLIIELRTSVKEAAKAQLENAVINANDYLREVNAEDQARQAMILHRLQLLQAKINYQTITGK